MNVSSIRLRLVLAAGVMIILALIASALSIAFIFERHLEKRVFSELDKHFTQLASALEVKPDGTLELAQELADPRFSLPLSGLYWQVDLDGKPMARSRSLWDQSLVVPTPPSDEEEAHVHELAGPDDQMLFSLERSLLLNHLGSEKRFVVTVGLERGEISNTVLSMTRDVAPALSVLGLLLLLAAWLQVSLGLKPLTMIQKAVEGIRARQGGRVDENVAAEVKPLVSELNALLDANDERTLHARRRAADLAHGLRTPLTILGSISRDLEEAGRGHEAEKIRVQTEHMRQQVELELAIALSSAEEQPQWLDIAANLKRLIDVVAMQGAFNWEIVIPDSSKCRLSRNDFNEIFGNLLENTKKWGRSRARVSIDGTSIVVSDDGPGIAEADLEKVTTRGFTTGTATTSSGLGLSIVQTLATKNKLQLKFGKSILGGLQVSVEFRETELNA